MKKAKIHFTVLDAVLITLLVAATVFLIRRVDVEMHYRWQWPVILQYLIRTVRQAPGRRAPSCRGS